MSLAREPLLPALTANPKAFRRLPALIGAPGFSLRHAAT